MTRNHPFGDVEVDKIPSATFLNDDAGSRFEGLVANHFVEHIHDVQ